MPDVPKIGDEVYFYRSGRWRQAEVLKIIRSATTKEAHSALVRHARGDSTLKLSQLVPQGKLFAS